MTDLIAYLSTGKGTWGHVSRLLEGIDNKKWNKIYILTNAYGKENFKPGNNVELIETNENMGIRELRDDIKAKLKDKIRMEAAVNFISGSGKEHMALISALIQLGIGFRLVAVTQDGTKEL